VQSRPDGIAQAFLIGEDFLNGAASALVLGDNLIFGQDLTLFLNRANQRINGATVFGYQVNNPSAFGVLEFDEENKVISLEEKPENPKSSYAVPGLYFYDEDVCNIARSLKPSSRGELEITDLNNVYLSQERLFVEKLGRGSAWLDMGTHESLHRASVYIESIQHIHGYHVANLEEIAFRKGWINNEVLKDNLNKRGSSSYSEYLNELIDV